MCDPVGKLSKPPHTDPAILDVNPHAQLADLIEKETGVRISPELVYIFVTTNWAEVSALAHAIHKREKKGEADDQS